jgi:DNA polymerase I-like protein with 3'-5' exonuclease and polymerase domains
MQTSLFPDTPPPGLTVRTVDYRVIDTLDQLTTWVNQVDAAVIGLDIETTSLDPHLGDIRLIQFAEPGKPAVIVDLQRLDGDPRPVLNRVLGGPAKKVLQNAKFETAWLGLKGYDLRGPIYDTMIAHQLLTVGHFSAANLQEMAKKYLDEHLPKENQASDWSGPLTDEQLQYAARDAVVVLDIRDKQIPRLKDAGLIDVAGLEFAAIAPIAAMQVKGLRFDWDRVHDLVDQLVTDREAALAKFLAELNQAATQADELAPGIDGSVSFNPNSPTQLKNVLKAVGIPVESTDQKKLQLIADRYPLLQPYLEWKKLQTSVSSASKLEDHRHPVTGRVHTQFWQLKADSGRMTSSEPNVQNLPRATGFRSCVTPAAGYRFIVADYSQIELRIAAQVAPDDRMIAAYRDGEDLHRLTAALVNDVPLEQVTKAQRQSAKAVNFGLIYGMGAKGLKDYAKSSYGVELTLDEATRFRTKYFEAYAGLARWHRQLDAKLRGGSVYARTLSGRRRFLQAKDRKLTTMANTPVQGLGADILKVALALTHDRLRGLDAYLVNTVHDEIVVEAEASIADQVKDIVTTAMVEAGERFLTAVPVLVEVGICSDWGEK